MLNKLINFLKLFSLNFNKLNYSFRVIELKDKNKLEHYSLNLKHLYNYPFNHKIKINADKKIINELEKSFIKAKLRYDKNSITIAYEIAKLYAEINKIKFQEVYFTNCYPILHEPKDKIEEGTYHMDQDGFSKIITLWTPVTNYDYSALSYFKFGFFFHRFLKKIVKNKILNFYHKIEVVKFKTIVWGGLFIHKGNLNISSNYSSAAVIWISIGKKKKSDLSFNLKKFSERLENKKIKNETLFDKNYNKNIDEELVQLNIVLKKLINLSNSINFSFKILISNLKNILKDIDFQNNKNLMYSFLFSIFAQRLNTILLRKIDVRLKNISLLINCLDLLSIFTGLQNFSSFTRLYNSKLLTQKNKYLFYEKLIEYKIFKNQKEINNFINKGFNN